MATPMREGVGLAGCGRMGAPMLAALAAAGIEARGFDIRPPSEFGALAERMTDDPDRFAAGLRVLISVVRDIPQTEELLFSDQGFLSRAPALETVILSSTLSPRYVRELRARVPRHIALIDAPMSGAAVAAQERRLSFMLGGDRADLDRAQPLFDAMGAHFHRMGGYGAGMAAKVLNNLLAASSTAMTRLVLDWADAEGIDERRLLDLIATSSGQNWLASGFETIEFARDGWAPDNSIGILVKDVESALDAAPDGADTDLPRAVQTAIRHLTPRPKK
ncbi:NAD(P)-dependent oxidoreductase [Acidimangrovimonas pyrenivorans]|uniref:NAD(P)-dependent oxidoreductase n=1 Tax=Acidimangrovimonas pyrenivorans TaxID=2030798 RepID=A0ABV7ABZ9_9RHOB